MKALRLYAGPAARQHLAQHGLRAQDVRVIPAAAGGPKGLVLGPLDRFVFGEWLAGCAQPVHLVGASIGAWRMATACLNDPVAALGRLERDYIRQHIELQPGQKRPSAQLISERFGQNLSEFYAGRVHEVLQHPRYRLHIVTSRGRHVLGREQAWRTPLGYLGAFLTNAMHRKAMGAWLERVVFSSHGAPLPFATQDYRTRQVALNGANFHPALQASCSIPFVLQSVRNVPGAPPGAYWDGGITDYHMHLHYAPDLIASSVDTVRQQEHPIVQPGVQTALVLYPHFQRAVVPGWFDKGLKWRHGATHFLDNVVVLAPDPQWIKSLPNGKLPDRTDFQHYSHDPQGRMKAWSTAVSASQQLADELQEWLLRPDPGQVDRL